MQLPGEMYYRMKLSPIPKGFKTKAEAKSLEIRSQLNLSATVACPARLVAGLFNTSVIPLQSLNNVVAEHLTDLFDHKVVNQRLSLLSSGTSGFSAVAVVVENLKLIIFNDANSVARQESDIMHELAHIICEHPGDCLQLNSTIGLRNYNAQYEEEASWLGATLQIPDQGLYKLAKLGYTNQQIAEIFGASLEMTTYRRRILAIDRRLSFSKSKSMVNS